MNEWIGFFVSIAILLYLLLRTKPAKEPQEQEDAIQEYLKGSFPAQPPPKPIKQPKIVLPPKHPEERKQAIVSSYFEKEVHYDVIGKKEPSRGQKMVQTLKDKRDMVILHEIIGPPKCKRR